MANGKITMTKEAMIEKIKDLAEKGYKRFPEKGESTEGTIYGELIEMSKLADLPQGPTKAEVKRILKWPELKGLRISSGSTTGAQRSVFIFTDADKGTSDAAPATSTTTPPVVADPEEVTAEPASMIFD